jgi:hypothetical protein
MLARTEFLSSPGLGRLVNTCFEWLMTSHTPVAVKVHCMDILYRLSEKEPDIAGELASIIEWRMNEGSPGYKSHSQKILRKLSSNFQ